MDFQVNVKDIILKPKKDVFDEIANARRITKYFVSKPSGALVQGGKVVWEFSDYETKIELTILKAEKKTVFHLNGAQVESWQL